MIALTRLNATFCVHNLPVLYINKIVIIVGGSRVAVKAFTTQRENPHSDHNLNKNCLENIQSTCFVFCYCFELYVSSDM